MKQESGKKKHNRLISARTVVLVVIALIIGLGVYNWNAKNLAGNQLPMPFGVGMAVVLSGSMEDRLSKNDLTVIKQADSYRENDIVVFQSGGDLVIHRILSIDGETVITKGDANDRADDPINIKDIKGKLIFDIPFVGLLINFIRNPIVVLMILVAAFFMTEYSLRREKDGDREDLDKIRAAIEELKQMADAMEQQPTEEPPPTDTAAEASPPEKENSSEE